MARASDTTYVYDLPALMEKELVRLHFGGDAAVETLLNTDKPLLQADELIFEINDQGECCEPASVCVTMVWPVRASSAKECINTPA
jgi:hypothetical protein